METKFNFNSQICTSIEQSRRLLELGLKRETADMVWAHAYYGTWVATASENPLYEEGESIPAWSLHRLIEMIPEYFADTKLKFRIEAVKWLMQQGVGNVYDNLVILIADCIKNNIFNKEYLEE